MKREIKCVEINKKTQEIRKRENDIINLVDMDDYVNAEKISKLNSYESKHKPTWKGW